MVPAHPLDAFQAEARCGASGSGAGAGSEAYLCVSGDGGNLQLIDGSGLLALCKDYGIPARIVLVVK
jgi:hypothetical protein